MTADLLRRKRTHFVLWRPAVFDPAPRVVLGTLRDGDAPSFAGPGRGVPRIGAGSG